jgi:hemoglobin/transferrin/lactoferrin receptor protein
LAIYLMRFENRITGVETGDVTDTGRTVVQNRNVRQADYFGIEFGFSQLLAHGVTVDASLNWTRGDEDLDGVETPADRVPPLSGHVAVSREFAADWRVGAELYLAGRQDRLSPRDLSDPRIDPTGTDGYAVVNVRAAWRAGRSITLGAAVENLTNERYREHGSGIDQPGRGIVLTFDWRY